MGAVTSAIAGGIYQASYAARAIASKLWRLAETIEDTTEREWRVLGLMLLAAVLASLERSSAQR